MPRRKASVRFEITPHRNKSGTVSFRVTGTKKDGTRLRQNFAQRADAARFLADTELEEAGRPEARLVQRTALSVQELSDAESALKLAPGRSLAGMVSQFLNLEQRAFAKGLGLDAAISFVEARFRPEIQERTVLNAYDEFVSTRVGLEARTLTHYKASLRLLLRLDPNRLLHSFTVADIEAILRPYIKSTSRRTYRRSFSVFFNWAVRHHYCQEDPCRRLDKIPADSGQIAILEFDEIVRLLSAALHYKSGSAAAVVAISLFAGLRPGEVSDLEPSDVGKDKIRVTGGKLRRTLKRSVPIPPVLAEWLHQFPFKGLPVGWEYKFKLLKKATNAKNWVQDVLRHTSLSYQAERDKDEALTAFNNGTSKGMMDRHYRNSIDDERILKEFWQLTPETVVKRNPDVALPTAKRIQWPSVPHLRGLVWKRALIHVAKELGVSDVALRKYCLSQGVELPPKGHWLKRPS